VPPEGALALVILLDQFPRNAFRGTARMYATDPKARAVALNRRLGQPWLSHAEGHRSIIRRFGRFPHRNPILGRDTTAEEARFLRNGGFRG